MAINPFERKFSLTPAEAARAEKEGKLKAENERMSGATARAKEESVAVIDLPEGEGEDIDTILAELAKKEADAKKKAEGKVERAYGQKAA